MIVSYKTLVQSLFLGFIVGALFTFFGLPIPAPDNLYAIFGIIGLFMGMIIMMYIQTGSLTGH